MRPRQDTPERAAKGVQTKARRRLNAWLTANGETESGLAALVGLKQQMVSRYCLGLARPTLLKRKRFQKVCGIPADDWMTEEEQKAERAFMKGRAA